MIKDFEDLIIYKKSRILAKQVFDVTKDSPFAHDYRFVQQIRAAAGSISDNIAEGFERQGNKEFKNFLYIAKQQIQLLYQYFVQLIKQHVLL